MQFLFFGLLPCCGYKRERRILNDAKTKIESYLDVNVYLKKIEEVESLKNVLMNEEQISIFNLISKPSILRPEDVKEIKELNHEGYVRRANLEKIISDYEKINQSNHKTEQDIKIINLFNREMTY